MATYFFPLRGDSAHVPTTDLDQIPNTLAVMHAGELVCEAHFNDGSYSCELPPAVAARFDEGKLEQIFVYEPPITTRDHAADTVRELVSILLVPAAGREDSGVK